MGEPCCFDTDSNLLSLFSLLFPRSSLELLSSLFAQFLRTASPSAGVISIRTLGTYSQVRLLQPAHRRQRLLHGSDVAGRASSGTSDRLRASAAAAQIF